MNKQSIDTARDKDLRLSSQAIQRAAQRAHDLAAQTGTSIVVRLDGVIQHIQPQQKTTAPGVQEPPTPYGEKP